MSWKDALNDFKVSEGLAKPAASSSASSSSSSSWRDAPAASASLGYTSSAIESTDLREARRLRERKERERMACFAAKCQHSKASTDDDVVGASAGPGRQGA